MVIARKRAPTDQDLVLRQRPAGLQQRLDAFCREVLANQTERLIAGIRIVDGSPARAIPEEARRAKAELIVLGSHGHPAIGEAVLGSVAHKITVKATVPAPLMPIGQRG